jgi:uncharacterized protein YdeI (YjbR/CyaY-like superfamily)
MKTLDVPGRAQWRAWLAKNHDVESEVWLIFHKRHSGRASIEYQDALDEALCFGWIDSLIKRLDDARYARKFNPRRPDSKWSEVNRKRYAELEAQGRLATAGRKRPPGRGYEPRPSSSKVPPYIRQALRKRPAAESFFAGLAPSYRRLYILWIDSAKREEAKLRRLNEALDLLAAGKKLGLK